MKLFKKKIPLLIVSFVAFIGIFYAPPAHAWSLFSFGASVISDILYSLILTPLSWILAWAGSLVNFAIQPGNLPLTAAKNTFVQTGWTAMRDLTNMLFILIMLAIALDYILFNSVGVKRALPRLLLVALLINFSLPIAGVVIDFANVFTDFFIKQVGGPQFTEVLANKLGLVNIFSIEVTQPADSLINIQRVEEGALTSTLFSIFFVIGTVFVLFALAIMFFIRYFYLSILLIVLPLVLVASILPQLGSHYKKWTNKFISWTMFAPAAAFFLYLSMVFLDTQAGTFTATMKSAGWISGFAAQATTFIFAWMLMLASLTTANSMGIAGASVAINTWNKGTRWARGKAWGATKAGMAATGRRFKAEEKVDKIAGGLRGIPGLGGVLSSGVRSVAVRTGEAIKKQEALTQKQKTAYESYSDEQLLAEYNTLKASKLPGYGAKAAQVAAMLVQRKGNALTIKNEDGTVRENETLELRKSAWDLAHAHGNKEVKDALAAKDPRVGRHAIDIKYKDPTQKIDGKTKAEALVSFHKNIKAKDIEELPDSFFASQEGKDLVRDMMNEKALQISHLRAAVESQKNNFLSAFKATLPPEGIGEKEDKNKGVPATGLFVTNPGLANSLTGNAGAEVIGYVS